MVYGRLSQSILQKRMVGNGYETHRRFIDIHFPLQGIEKVKCETTEHLEETKGYDVDNDYLLFSSKHTGAVFIIENGYFLVLIPNDSHMPQLCVEETMTI